MTTPYPVEPPTSGPEAPQLLGALDRQRATFRFKVDGLDAAGLAVTVGASSLTLGGLLKHLALVETFYTTQKLSGAPLGEPWESTHDGTDEWEFVTAATDAPADLYRWYDEAVARSRERIAAAIEAVGLDGEAHVSDGEGHHASVRRLLLDLLEEYGRHTGHADLIREAVDGRVGEDPDSGWTPTDVDPS